MIYRDEEQKRPEVLGARTVGIALAIHAAFFLFFYLLALFCIKKPEVIIPIDLTVVVNENLDGDENEPPPLDDAPPPPPKPAPPPEPPPELPKAEEKIEAVEQIVEKKPERKKPEEKKPEKKKDPEKKKEPEKPVKTAEELRRERIERMRESARVVQKPVKIKVENAPSGNGRTERQTLSEAEIRRLLNQGYRPGTKTQLAASEEQRCLSLIKAAFYAKWTNRPAWNDTLRKMHLEVRFGAGGRVMGYRLVQSSGNAQADATVKQAAAMVPVVYGLSADFLAKFKTVTIRFEVTPE
jgi:outer membrane biosynthesis protein TonB